VKAKQVVLALGMLGALAASAWTVAAEQPFPQAPVVGEHENFRNLYRLRCGTCHGANGEGTDQDYPRLAPALKGNPFVQHAPPAAIIAVIRKGRTGPQRLYHESYPNMPAFGAEAVFDVDGLVHFLQTDLQK
jgi:mono/diheme cytochrome c family protein